MAKYYEWYRLNFWRYSVHGKNRKYGSYTAKYVFLPRREDFCMFKREKESGGRFDAYDGKAWAELKKISISNQIPVKTRSCDHAGEGFLV